MSRCREVTQHKGGEPGGVGLLFNVRVLRRKFIGQRCRKYDLTVKMFLYIKGSPPWINLRFSSVPSESSGQQSETAASTESPCDASCSGALSSSSVQSSAEGPSEGGAVAPAERSEPEGTEDTSGGCRRAEPTGDEGEEGQSQPARGNQDSDDSDDDPILIPPTRFRGQGQRYVQQHAFLIFRRRYYSFVCHSFL